MFAPYTRAMALFSSMTMLCALLKVATCVLIEPAEFMTVSSAQCIYRGRLASLRSRIVTVPVMSRQSLTRIWGIIGDVHSTVPPRAPPGRARPLSDRSDTTVVEEAVNRQGAARHQIPRLHG